MGSLFLVLSALLGLVLALIYNHCRAPRERPEPPIGVHERDDERRREIARQLADACDAEGHGVHIEWGLTGGKR